MSTKKKTVKARAEIKNPYPELPARVTVDALEAKVPSSTAAQQKLFLRNLDVEAAIAWGVQADSQDILDDVPGYVGEAVNILHTLGARFDAVHLPAPIFHAVLVETRALADAKKTFDDKTSTATGAAHGKKTDVRKATKSGVALRDKTVTALRNALGKDATQKLDAAVTDASTPENLAKGLRAVATFLDEALDAGDDDTISALELWSLSDATSTALAAAATGLGNFGDASVGTHRVEQRKLDQQDGNVLYLLDIIDRAFKQARRADPTILVPTFHKLASVFGRHRAAAAAPADPTAPSPPAAPPPAPTPPAASPANPGTPTAS
jgi:hypothetical protein